MNTTQQADTTATPAAQVRVPDLKTVKSSQIFAIGYDAPTLTLAIQFVSKAGGNRNAGSLYLYDNVPAEVFNGFASAQSTGKYFGEHIKGQFSFRKLS